MAQIIIQILFRIGVFGIEWPYSLMRHGVVSPVKRGPDSRPLSQDMDRYCRANAG